MKVKHHAPFLDFNARTFCEGFRQLRTVGILALVIMCLAAVLLPVGSAISSYTVREYEQNDFLVYEPVFTREPVTLAEMHPLSLVPMYTLALLMPLIAFSFLNKRQASDFYHALPVSRAGLFTSLFAAIMAWICLDLLVSTVVSVITVSCFPALFQLVWSSVLPTLCISIAGALMVAGCMTFAMCITGTLLTNLLVAALLFFGPRLLMWYVSTSIENGVSILPNVNSMPILDISYNIPLGIFSGSVSNFDNWSGIIYSAVVGILYCIGALAIFRTRRSEAAEQPAATPVLQTVYRLFLTFIVTLLPLWIILERVNDEKHLSESQAFGVFVLYILAALTFCIYELITTKKPKLLLKAAPTFLIVLAADLLLVGGISLGQYNILAFRPTVDEIGYVSIETTDSGDRNEAYFNSVVNGLKIDNKKIIELVAKHLSDAAEHDSPYAGYHSDNWTHCTVTVHTNGTDKSRLLAFTTEEYLKICEQLENNADYRQAYTLPPLTRDTRVDFQYLTDEQAIDVYNVMREEVAAMPFTERHALLQNMTHDNAYGLREEAVLQVSHNGKTYILTLPITPKHYPKAYTAFLGYFFENQTEERKNILYWLPNIYDREMEFTMTLTTPDATYHRTIEVDSNIMTVYAKSLLVDELLPRISNEPYDKDDTLLHIGFTMPKINSDKTAKTEYYQWYAYFGVSDDFTSCEAFLDFAAEADERQQRSDFYDYK